MRVALHHVSDGPAELPVLVLAGSLGSTTEMWRPQLPALTGRSRVIRVDLRGHGGSPATGGPCRMDELAGDVLALLDDLGLRRVHWCGLSLGAMVGMYLASEAPERIGRLALCCTSAHFADPVPWHDRIAALAAWDHRDRLPAITAPTLVVAGADDPATPVEPHATTLTDGIPGLRLEVVPGAHLATIESADAVNALLVDHHYGR